MNHILSELFNHQVLTKEDARNLFISIGTGEVNEAQISAILTVFNMRSLTINELNGFREALLELCLAVDLSEFEPMDVCGTGGDNKNTFNISTCCAFVVSGAGINVAKHGNAGVSSSCGSSDLLQYFGINFTNDLSCLKNQIDASGICFLHAPLFHPAMKNVAPIRRQLKIKTIFNMLGPLVNPANPAKQSAGVFSLELARLYQYLFQSLNTRYVVLHSLDGYDEISLTGPFKFISNNIERIYTPEILQVQPVSADQITGGRTIKESADIFMNILKNESTPAQKEVVIANAAAAVYLANEMNSFSEAAAVARESLESGNALKRFNKFRELANLMG